MVLEGRFRNHSSDEAIAQHMRFGRQPAEHVQSTMHLYPINGAVHQVAAEATAFSYRKSNWAEVIVGMDPGPRQQGKNLGLGERYWDAPHPYSAGARTSTS